MTKDSRAQRASTTTQESPETSTPTRAVSDAASLAVVHCPDATAIGKRIAIDRDVLAFGRDVDGSGLCIDDLQLSRVHFRLVYDGRAGHHRVGDVSSRNGTFVDGARVQSALLGSGAVLRAGETVFVYDHGDAMRKARDRVSRVAASDVAVMLLGETGTGKERLARAVHEQSGRSGPFVAVNCAALPRELLGAELFGHTRGAFSGAQGARLGLFQAADRGTLLLDEIGDLPHDLQAALLRALQEGSVRPLGSDAEVRVDVRVVAATHQDLQRAVADKHFRSDLYARLAQVIVTVPPLRERRAEIVALAQELATSASGASFRLTADAAELVTRHGWQFNVRELQSLVRAFVASSPDAVLGLPYLAEYHPELVARFREGDTAPLDTRPSEAPRAPGLRDRSTMAALLTRHQGNVSAAAAELGKPRALLYRWLRQVGLDPERFRTPT